MTYNTDRRGEIISLLSSESDKAFTTEEICKRIITEGGKSTVYRIISDLTAKGIIKKLSDPNTRHVRYQYLGKRSCAEHLHLKCKSCERLIHLDRSTSELIMNHVKSAGGFSVDPTEILSGLCSSCQGKEN